MTPKPLHIPADGGRTKTVMSSTTRDILTGAQTGGAFFLSELRDVPGGGVPPHVHSREEETFHVLEGEVEFGVDGEVFTAGPGAVVFCPRGVAHTFRPLTPIRMTVLTSPAGMEGMFEELSRLDPDAGPAGIVEVCRRYGIEFV